MARGIFGKKGARPGFHWAVIALLALVALTGGSSRADMTSLLLLRPVSVAVAAWALWTAKREQIVALRPWLILVGGSIAVLLLQLVPLPPGVWRALPGRDLVASIDDAHGLADTWRPISLNPQMTRNALWFFAAPIAALLLGARLDRDGRSKLLGTVLLVGIASGLLGMAQYISGPDSALYLYRISNFGSAVGLFANRNHAGVFLACMFPLLAAYAYGSRNNGRQRWRAPLALAGAAVLLPLILITGSRAGLLVAVLGLAGAAVIARSDKAAVTPAKRPRKRGNLALNRWALGLGVVGFAAFCAVSIGLMQGNSLDRALGSGSQLELRWPIWRVTLHAAAQMFPFGSGFGAFPPVFQVYEPDAILNPSYVNHAHNDFLEVYHDGGIIGIMLMIAGLFVFARGAWGLRTNPEARRSVAIGQASALAIGQLLVASVFDYPLRTPLIAVFACFLIVWMRFAILAGTDGVMGSNEVARGNR